MNQKNHKIVEYIRSIYKDKKQIPLHEPSFFGNERKYLNSTIDSGFVSSVGEYVNKLEDKIQKINNSKKAIAVINGTSGLHTSLLLSGVKNGDDVITQALTFVATSNISSLDSTIFGPAKIGIKSPPNSTPATSNLL